MSEIRTNLQTICPYRIFARTKLVGPAPGPGVVWVEANQAAYRAPKE